MDLSQLDIYSIGAFEQFPVWGSYKQCRWTQPGASVGKKHLPQFFVVLGVESLGQRILLGLTKPFSTLLPPFESEGEHSHPLSVP